MKASEDKICELVSVYVGLYVVSSCGRCGYGPGDEAAVVLISSIGVAEGKALCFRCFANEAGDPRSATHRRAMPKPRATKRAGAKR